MKATLNEDYSQMMANNFFAIQLLFNNNKCFHSLTSIRLFNIKHSQTSLKSLFAKPSFLFLFIFGFVIEITAAMTRVFNDIHIEGTSVLFSLVFATGSFIICYFNQSRAILYLFVFASFGLMAEIVVGISADISRGNTYYTAYFVTALILGILTGGLMGLKFGKQPGLISQR